MRKLFLVVSLSVSMFATDKSNYETAPKSQSEQLQVMKQKRDKIRQELNEIPGLQQKIIGLQKTIEKATKGQRKMVDLYLKSRKICEQQKAKNELAGMSYSRLTSNYEKCKADTGEESVFGSHSQLMRDIASFKQTIADHIIESEDLVGRKDTLEVSGQYADEAILMLEEAVNGGGNSNTEEAPTRKTNKKNVEQQVNEVENELNQ